MNTHAQTASATRYQVVGTGLVALDLIDIGGQRPIFEELGGSAGNVLISLAMLGRSVIPLVRLGADTVGARLERDLRLAGADTRLVCRHPHIKSPVIVENLDLATGEHSFSFSCPQSSERFSSFQPITLQELETARSAVAACTIFYTDRISETICKAMEAAAAGGAIVHFEPSSISDPELFERALSTTHIFKYSTDRLLPRIVERLRPEAFSIVTAGRSGLEVTHAGSVYKCEALDAKVVRDTCGAGDMVTLGLLDTIIQHDVCSSSLLTVETVLAGVLAGQRLAAANCAYIGARGIFRERGAQHVRATLNDPRSYPSGRTSC